MIETNATWVPLPGQMKPSFNAIYEAVDAFEDFRRWAAEALAKNKIDTVVAQWESVLDAELVGKMLTVMGHVRPAERRSVERLLKEAPGGMSKSQLYRRTQSPSFTLENLNTVLRELIAAGKVEATPTPKGRPGRPGVWYKWICN